jgi:hypothetical protein
LITAFAYASGTLCVMMCYAYFLHATVIKSEKYPIEKTYNIDLWPPAKFLKSTLTPPKFVVKGQSHVLADHNDLKWNRKTDKSFWQAPSAYLNWNTWQRFYVMWNFDNAYNGDVYIYPMVKKGFEEKKVLSVIHYGMAQLHWPLFLLSVAAPFFWERKKSPLQLSRKSIGCLITTGSFFYFMVVLFMLGRWLPRYTIPLRPLSYIMAAMTFHMLYIIFRGVKGRAQH